MLTFSTGLARKPSFPFTPTIEMSLYTVCTRHCSREIYFQYKASIHNMTMHIASLERKEITFSTTTIPCVPVELKILEA
jgi:hypothetical protein